MSQLDFGQIVTVLQDSALRISVAERPIFSEARSLYHSAGDYVAQSDDDIKRSLFIGKNASDLGEVDIREALYLSNVSEGTERHSLDGIDSGLAQIRFGYEPISNLLN